MSEGSVIRRVILVPWGSMAPPDFTWEELAVSSTIHTQSHPRALTGLIPEATPNQGQRPRHSA